MNHQNVVSGANAGADSSSTGEASGLFIDQVMMLCDQVLQRSLPSRQE
ncbi:MAG TPA: hypothetical protein VNV88_05060 [Candidatus Solibacter sp.]|nr:hypothetical protein [Candidatus Solibacter sp.]